LFVLRIEFAIYSTHPINLQKLTAANSRFIGHHLIFEYRWH